MPVQAKTQSAPTNRRWSPRSIAILVLAWIVLQIGGLFTPGLLDDVDSIYIEIAREMLRRHDFVTPYINGVRFFDKPPLMYWMAAGSMRIFGPYDWAARIPLALAVLALLFAVYALGIRLFSNISPAGSPDRGGFYAALAIATSIGPYLYTRFYIPDILLALWMTLAVHLLLIALDRLHVKDSDSPQNRVPHSSQSHRSEWDIRAKHEPLSSSNTESPGTPSFAHSAKGGINKSALLPCLAFAAVMALNVLTKGLIGLVFPIGFVLLYLALTKQLRLLPRLHLISGTAVFLAIAAPWHILAALRTPAIPLPAGLGLPATGGWAWFYLYNEHIARFLGRRIPHDYGQVPIPLFWLLSALWIMPWVAFLPGGLANQIRTLRNKLIPTNRVPHSSQSHRHKWAIRARHEPLSSSNLESPGAPSFAHSAKGGINESALSLLLWALLVLGFFTLSSRQEYYALPALPALALMAASLLTQADAGEAKAQRSSLAWSLWFLVPLTTFIAFVCGYFALTAPHSPPGTDIASLLAANPEFYNLSLGHLFDLTGDAMGLFRGPLAAAAVSMLAIGLGSYFLRRSGRTYVANLTLAAAMTVTLLAAHEGLARFYPILGSKSLALAINQAGIQPTDLILLDGELTSGSTLVFYTGQRVHLINGNVNGLWYGSFWPDAPKIFETEEGLRQLWASPRRIFLFTYNPTARTRDLAPLAPVHTLATAGGKTILTNR
ncbi:MAG TPA: glycosyltransferase family 39 protein [Edaphobacter sp.]|nr:glycosyltransferase family 39 protein [Edaphobacter sp.]